MEQIEAQHEQTVTTLRTLWHPLVYHLHKAILIPRNAEVVDELDASEQPPKIDLVLRHSGERWSEEQRAVLPDGVRDRHLKHHLFEFKITESVSLKTFKQADMYDLLYPRLKNLKDHEFQTYIVSSKTPRSENLEAWGYKEADYPGVYTSTNPRCEYIVMLVLNELRNVPHNNYFRLFASRKKVRESALESLLQTHAVDLTDDPDQIVRALLTIGQAYNIEVEGLNMEPGFSLEALFERSDSLRQALIAGASLEERLIGLKPEERLIGLKPEQIFGVFKPEQVLKAYKPEVRVTGLKPKERLAGLSVEDKRLLMEELQRSLAEESLEEAAPERSQEAEVDMMVAKPDSSATIADSMNSPSSSTDVPADCENLQADSAASAPESPSLGEADQSPA